MQQTTNIVLTPSAFVIVTTRVLGFVVSNYSKPGVMGNRFPKKCLVFFQARHYIFTSILPMSNLKKRKPENSLILKTHEFFKFWEPIVVVITGILTVLLELELFHHLGKIQF